MLTVRAHPEAMEAHLEPWMFAFALESLRLLEAHPRPWKLTIKLFLLTLESWRHTLDHGASPWRCGVLVVYLYLWTLDGAP